MCFSDVCLEKLRSECFCFPSCLPWTFLFPSRVSKVPTLTHVLSFGFEIHCIGRARNLRKHSADFEITCSLPWAIFRGICLKVQASPFLDKAEVLPFERLAFQERAQVSKEAGR